MKRTLENVMRRYQCGEAAARIYMDYREEGYSVIQAALIAGIVDPPAPKEPAKATGEQQ